MSEGDRILAELITVLGEENVSNDPAIRVPYSRDQTSSAFTKFRYPDYVVLPESTEEVQRVVSIANRFKITIIPWTTGANVAGKTIPIEGGIQMDLKKMNKILEIDEDTMTATVQPYVPMGRLQVEAKKRGFRIDIPGAPSSVGVISNYCTTFGMHFHSNKYGWGAEKIVGLEMVLPTGEILRTGYLALKEYGAKNIAANGLGMDLSGIPYNSLGTLGVVTQMTIKMFPLGQEKKIIFATFNKVENGIQAYAEVAREELGIGLGAAGPAFWTTSLPFATREEALGFLKQSHPMGILVWAEIEGTLNQIAYQEKKVREIFRRFKGDFTVGDILSETITTPDEKLGSLIGPLNKLFNVNLNPYWLRRSKTMFDVSETPCRAFLLRGGLLMREVHNTFQNYLKQYAFWKKTLKKHGYQGLDDGFWSMFISSYGASDLVCELDLLWDPQDKVSKSVKSAANKELLPEYLKLGSYHLDAHSDEWDTLGPHYGFQYSLLKRMKGVFDPNNIMHRGELYP